METTFRIRPYGRMELAQAYLPAMTPKAAHRKLQHLIAIYPGLADRLHDMGYRPTERLYSPAMVRAIVEALGEP